ncbi:uncharacterized protein sS8_3579 [Methylocaldum marinum]|uniref:Potassium channel domain-containing protein n=1 Tax=Methylocaldum marinum TaxID=1432792 RepID=A0A250KVG3_9GAMM|nr:uncharacterized protein sS8_3579 [Methylocaldum marinum]
MKQVYFLTITILTTIGLGDQIETLSTLHKPNLWIFRHWQYHFFSMISEFLNLLR